MTRALALSVFALLSLSACKKTETTPPPDATAPADAPAETTDAPASDPDPAANEGGAIDDT